MRNPTYEKTLGEHCLTFAPAHLDEQDAQLAVLANMPEFAKASTHYALACRHLAITGDDSKIAAYLDAEDIAAAFTGYTREDVAAGRRLVEEGRMLHWTTTGTYRAHED